ncbi:MAG: MerR family transcriptional regulator [Anaerolineae bacterium]|nr:MerR family transcriptional regulator [Anaerolineae bacterium]
MLKIGEFAALTQISVRMLRHYDEIGLLKPSHVDRESGYRYYTLDQLPDLNRIVALKDLGLSLEEIRLLLDQSAAVPLSAAEIRGMLKLKRAQLQQRIQEEQERLLRVENRLRQIEDEGCLPEVEVVFKQMPEMHVLALSGTGYAGHLFQQTYPALKQAGLAQHIRGRMTLYLGSLERQRTGTPPSPFPIEIAYIVTAAVTDALPLDDGRVLEVKTIPAYKQVISLISRKPDHERHLDARLLWRWLRQHHYLLVAPTRELYLQRPCRTNACLTEMLMPVAPITMEDTA